MKREIKFRGKKKVDNGEWVYGCLIQRIDCTEIHDGVFTWAIKPETVGQFTGLKDKNGVEIYEGDIIKYSHDWEVFGVYEEIEDVKFVNGGFAPLCYPSGGVYYVCDGVEYEVIGNIHENPELLNE